MAINYRVINKYFFGSYSQKGEDLAIYKYLKNKTKGFYVDIGASHPERFSNTKYFYNKGWKGINVEPDPIRIELFKRNRKRDINLNFGISNKKGFASFYKFDPQSFSTLSKQEAQTLVKVGYKLQEKIKIKTFRLADILKKYAKKEIDFMTVDTEGLDLLVLKSNDWNKFRPKVVCVETIDFIDALTDTKSTSKRKLNIDRYLLKQGYEEYLSNGLNTLYIEKRIN